MQPATAMGTFLRVWRSEWVALSRAQLANAVQRHLSGRKAVTPGVVRRWESGQPPADTAELEALCLVMGAHDLTAPEVEQFRKAALLACVDRHYEGLFGKADEVDRPDVDEWAEHYLTRWTGFAEPEGLVQVVAFASTLRAWLQEDGRCSERLRRRRMVALSNALVGVGALHGLAHRKQLCAQAWREASALLQAAGCVGPGASRAGADLVLRMMVRHETGHGQNDASAAWGYVRLAEEARERGSEFVHATCQLAAAHLLSELSPPVLVYEDWQPQIVRCAAVVTDAGPQPGLPGPDYDLFCATLHAGLLTAAERHLAGFEEWARGWPALWHWCTGRLAFEAGRYHEAQTEFERSVADARPRYGDSFDEISTDELLKCERAQHETRHRGKGRTVTGTPPQT